MNYKTQDIERYFKSPDPNLKCVLLFGTNEGMIADLSKKFILSVVHDINDAFRISQLLMDDIEKDVGLLFGEYNANSLMGGRRVILIKDVTNNITKPLKELFDATSSDTLLVMTSSTLNTKSSLVSFVKDSPFSALISCYDDRQEDISSYVRNFIIERNITITNDAFVLLCQRLSADRKASAGELEKLLTYLGSRKNITADDVQKAVSDTAATSGEDLCYYTASGDAQNALRAYKFLINEGQEPVQILRLVAYHFLRLLECRAIIENKGTPEGAAATLRPPLIWFRKSDFMMQLKIWNRDSILDVLSLLYKAEKDCKTTGFPAEDIADYTLMQILSAVKRLKSGRF